MILVLGVFEIEIDPVRKEIMSLETGEILGRPFVRGVVGPNEVITAYGFIGKVEAAMITQAFVDKFHPTAIVFTGAAGALSNFLNIGDIVIGDEYFEYDLGRRDGKVELIEGSERLIERVEEHLEGAFVGRIASGDAFVDSQQMREELRRLTRAVAVDMDSAAVAKVCKENNVDFVAIKTIVNRCDEEEFQKNYEKLAGKTASLLVKIIDHHVL